MSEENSLLGEALVGLSAESSPVESASQEPSFESIVDANNKTADDFLNKLLVAKGEVDAPAEEQPSSEEPEVEVAEVSEESSEENEVETPADESTDDNDSVVEESDEDEFVKDDSDVDLFDLESLKDGAFEVQWGDETKTMTWDQIQKQLDRSRSASEKSREAKELIEQFDAKQTELADRESRLEKLDISNQHDRELVELDIRYREVSKRIADAEGSVPKTFLDAQQAIVARFNEVQAEKNQLMDSMRVEIPSDMVDYVSSKLSHSAQTMIATDPSMIELVKKAQRWDESQKKIANNRPKLQAKKAGQKGKGGAKVATGADSKKEAAKQAIKKQQFSQVDPDMFLQSYLSRQS